MTSNDISHVELEPLPASAAHQFLAPVKRINDGDDLAFFFVSTAYRDLTKWLLQLDQAMFPTRHNDETPIVHSLDSLTSFSENIERIRTLLSRLEDLIHKAPPDTGPRRFGNVAFRTWHRLAEESAADLVRESIRDALPDSAKHDHDTSNPLVEELKAYLVGGFGSSQRLDYGTGHELSFLAFLGCLWKLGFFQAGEESAIVIGVIQPYLELVRKLILTYTLEPAGSHGVWGLDDHSFLPYIFGSAQLGPAIQANDPSAPIPTEGSLASAPPPSSVMDKKDVAQHKDRNMYFSAIQFIYDVKKGPFWEHSPVLYDISGIKDGWGKINKGMIKMYVAEVLGKFPVVQHFPFGSLFEWKQDASAIYPLPNLHVQQQPAALQSRDVLSGTSAPWARQGSSTAPQAHVNDGVPSMRAPWASNPSARASETDPSGVSVQRRSHQRMAPSVAPRRTKAEGT